MAVLAFKISKFILIERGIFASWQMRCRYYNVGIACMVALIAYCTEMFLVKGVIFFPDNWRPPQSFSDAFFLIIGYSFNGRPL
jgi:hypothetical protein